MTRRRAGWITAGLAGAWLLAGPAAAQAVDPAGTWACRISVYESGQPDPPEVFNVALYRDGSWASRGRKPDGRVYTGSGTWRYGPNRTGGFAVTIAGKVQAGEALAEPFEAVADILGPDALGRTTTAYRRTRALECSRL